MTTFVPLKNTVEKVVGDHIFSDSQETLKKVAAGTLKSELIKWHGRITDTISSEITHLSNEIVTIQGVSRESLILWLAKLDLMIKELDIVAQELGTR